MLIWCRVELDNETVLHDMGESAKEVADSIKAQLQRLVTDQHLVDQVFEAVGMHLWRAEVMDRTGEGFWLVKGSEPLVGEPTMDFTITIGRGVPPKVDTSQEAGEP